MAPPCEKHLSLAVDLAKFEATLEAQGRTLDLMQKDMAEQRETIVATLRCVNEIQHDLLKAVDERLAPFREAETTLKMLKWGMGAIGTAVVAIGIEAMKRMLDL